MTEFDKCGAFRSYGFILGIFEGLKLNNEWCKENFESINYHMFNIGEALNELRKNDHKKIQEYSSTLEDLKKHFNL